MAARTYGSSKACWKQPAASEDDDSQPHAALLPLLALGSKRMRSESLDDTEDSQLDSQDSCSPSAFRPAVQNSVELAASGKSAMDLDSLLYLMEGVGSPSRDVCRSSALSVAKAVKQAATRALVLNRGLLADLLSLLRAAQRGSDEAVVFVLAVMAYLLCRDDELAERFPPSSVTALAALLPGGASGAVSTPHKAPQAPQPFERPAAVEKQIAPPVNGKRERKLKLRRRTSAADEAKGGPGEADVVSQARLLLDRSDVVSWGLAARGSVSTADLALHALCRVVSASPTGRHHHMLAGDSFLHAAVASSMPVQIPQRSLQAIKAGSSQGESQESKSQDSQASAEQPSTVVTVTVGRPAAVVTEVLGTAHDHLRRSGAIELLSCLLTAAVLGDSCTDRQWPGAGMSPAPSNGPVSLIAAHQLPPSLRLLELVTFGGNEAAASHVSRGVMLCPTLLADSLSLSLAICASTCAHSCPILRLHHRLLRLRQGCHCWQLLTRCCASAFPC